MSTDPGPPPTPPRPQASQERLGDGPSAPSCPSVLLGGSLQLASPRRDMARLGLLMSCGRRANGPGAHFSEHPRPILKLVQGARAVRAHGPMDTGAVSCSQGTGPGFQGASGAHARCQAGDQFTVPSPWPIEAKAIVTHSAGEETEARSQQREEPGPSPRLGPEGRAYPSDAKAVSPQAPPEPWTAFRWDPHEAGCSQPRGGRHTARPSPEGDQSRHGRTRAFPPRTPPPRKFSPGGERRPHRATRRRRSGGIVRAQRMPTRPGPRFSAQWG